jgi:glycosyltransferase involved in cell wall biosynthesis
MWNKTARLSESIAESLSLLGRDVMVITPQINGGARRRWVDGIHITEIDDNPIGSWKENAKRLLMTMKGISEVIVIDSSSWQVVKDEVMYTGDGKEVPVIGIALFGQSVQGERIPSVKTDALIADENSLITDSNTLLVNNEVLRSRICSKFNREVGKLEMASSIVPETTEIIEQSNGHKNIGEVIVVGKIGPELGLEKVIRAMAGLPWLQLKVLGPARSDWELNRINTLIARMGVSDRVKFLGWSRTREVLTAIRAAEILIAPSQVEYFGYAVMDAMQMGTAVVASTANIHIELVDDGNTGLLFQNQDELKAALAQIHEVPELRVQYEEAGSEIIKSSRALTRMADSLAIAIGE